MTKEDCIEILKEIAIKTRATGFMYDAIKMAIEAVEKMDVSEDKTS